MQCVCISDLGGGWAPVILNSPMELILVHKIQKEMNVNHNYWIGGSTFVKHGQIVTFYDYITDITG